MYLYLYFQNGLIERHRVTRFSDLSETKSKYYYYEKPGDEHGKGKCVLRSEISCFEVSPTPLFDWDKHLRDDASTV